ncbi:hypothetical protein DSUL_100205 [Desulfovibrionales bacterium]
MEEASDYQNDIRKMPIRGGIMAMTYTGKLEMATKSGHDSSVVDAVGTVDNASSYGHGDHS